MGKFWWVKITICTFFIALIVSMLSELASSVSGIVVATLILLFLILISVLADGIGVSVTACDINEVRKLVKRNTPCSKEALILVENAEKVNNICADVIGDICSIISGACGAAIVIELMRFITDARVSTIIAIIVSSITAAITVGGKAIVKSIAINKSLEFVMYSVKIINKIINIEKAHNKHKKKGK